MTLLCPYSLKEFDVDLETKFCPKCHRPHKTWEDITAKKFKQWNHKNLVRFMRKQNAWITPEKFKKASDGGWAFSKYYYKKQAEKEAKQNKEVPEDGDLS